MSFSVKIVNIENNINNILLTDDLTIELLKVRYNWILNATIKNAVLGLDNYGLVWYMGEWICGEWEDGTWYSGIWHNGIWKNGRWYSYLLDKGMVLTKRFVILEEDKMYSQFLNGKWLNGTWNNGIFGNDNIISGLTSTQVSNGGIGCPYWYNGNFYNGLFKNSVWSNGLWFNGTMMNSYWLSGKFYNGYFNNYEWWSGSFFGGDFVKGLWKNGTFNQIKTDIPSRFGTETGTTTLTTWMWGLFENGQFMSGLNLDDSGNTIASVYHNVTMWEDGTFNNGIWYGGHFKKGIFNYGKWYGGIFNTNIDDIYTSLTIWKNGIWYDGLWLNGIFKGGMFFAGMWLNGRFENGFLVSEYQGVYDEDLKTNVVPKNIPPPPPPPSYSTPTVTIISVTTITYNSCIVNCQVTGTGGLLTVRGVCFVLGNGVMATINNSAIYDSGTGLGTYSILITGLSPSTFYTIRAFATNSYGTSYSLDEIVLTDVSSVPTVQTISSSNVTNFTANLTGQLISDGGSTVTLQGFVYSTTNPIPYFAYTTPITYPSPPFIGIYTLNLTGLLQDTTYYYRSIAQNSSGYGYGDVKSFKTSNALPIP